MALVLEANSLKRKRSKKSKEISEMHTLLETLEKKKNNAVVYFIWYSILHRVTRSRYISTSITVFRQNFTVHYQ